GGVVWLLDAATGHTLARSKGFPGWAAAIAPDGTWFVTGDEDGTLQTWDAATGELRHTFDYHEAQGWITQIDIAPDGTWFAWVAVGEYANTPGVRSGERPPGASRLQPEGFPGETVAIAPDGSSVAVGADSGLSVYDTSTGHTVLTRPWTCGKPHVAADGSWVA